MCEDFTSRVIGDDDSGGDFIANAARALNGEGFEASLQRGVECQLVDGLVFIARGFRFGEMGREFRKFDASKRHALGFGFVGFGF